MLRQLARILIPFDDDVTFFADYHQQCEAIRCGSQGKGQQPLAIQLFLCLSLCKALHFALLMWLPLTPFQRAINYDMIALVFGLADINIAGLSVTLSMAYMYYYFFFQAPAKNNRLLHEIAIKQLDRYFLYSHYKRVPICEYISTKLVDTFNRMQSFRIAIELLTVPVHGILVSLVYRMLGHGTSWSVLLYHNALLLVTGVFLNYFIWTFSAFISLVVSIGMVQLSVLSIKLKQLQQYLSGGRRGYCSHRQFYVYQHHLASTFYHFVEYNVVYGRLFVVFLVVNCPLNVYFVSLILHTSHLSLTGSLYLSAYALMQMLGIFVIQYYFVEFGKRLHAPSYLLVTLSVHSMHRMGDLRTRVRINCNIMTYHVVNAYGMTYDRFGGLVKMRTFASFLMLYFKFQLIAYRMINRM